MRNLLRWSLSISLGLASACGGGGGNTAGVTPSGAATQPNTAAAGTTGASPTASMAGSAAKPPTTGGMAMTTNTGAAQPAGGAKTGGSGAPAMMTTTPGSSTTNTAAAGSGAAGSGTATSGAMMAAAGTSAGAAGGGSATPATGTGGGKCGPDNMNAPAMLDKEGPWKPMHVERTGPTGASWIFFPADLGKDGFKHPVFDWGPGAGTGPDSYVDHLNLVASQGFVVISQASTNSGKQALDWILAENEKSGSMWYGKLDTTRVGRGGHSMGALQSFSEAEDPRLTLYVLVCGGGNGTGGAANIHAPSVFLGGEGEGGTVNFEGDYAAIKTAPSWFVTKTDTDHIYCARNNLAPWIAFMRMTWCGDEKYKAELSDGGTFCKSPWLACKSKNTM